MNKTFLEACDQAERGEWLCIKCFTFCNPLNEDWRWNGQEWEHHHNLAHVPSIRREV